MNKVKLIQVTPNSEDTLVYIARVSSNKSDDEKLKHPSKLINYLIKNKHWSPFEHSYMTVEITTSRAIAHQLIRHRSFTFQEFSQRYAEVNNFEDVEIRKQAIKNRQSSKEVFNPEVIYNIVDQLKFIGGADDIVKIHQKISESLYKELLDKNVAREVARFVLPLSTQTKLYMTGNIRSWVHFLGIRDDEHAQKEIQVIAKEIKNIFKDQFPLTSKALNYE